MMVARPSGLDRNSNIKRPEAFPRASEIAEALEKLRPRIILDDAGGAMAESCYGFRNEILIPDVQRWAQFSFQALP